MMAAPTKLLLSPMPVLIWMIELEPMSLTIYWVKGPLVAVVAMPRVSPTNRLAVLKEGALLGIILILESPRLLPASSRAK